MLKQKIDNIEFEIEESFDFSFLKEYGKVFQVFDQQDSGNLCFGTIKENKKYFIKLAGVQTKNYLGNVNDSIDRLKATLPIYLDLVHPSLIQLIEHKEIENGFYMVFEWIDGICMGRMYEKDHRLFMQFPLTFKHQIFEEIICFMEYVARKKYIAIDFYDGSILYDTINKCVKICDIDLFSKMPYINHMGRMWGSGRFMSPEEYQLGAVIDEVTNVYTLGKMAFSLYTDSDLALEQFPLSKECYQVLNKAISEDRNERYQSIKEFHHAWNLAFSSYSTGIIIKERNEV